MLTRNLCSKFEQGANIADKKLYIAVWDHDKWTANDFMGAMTFDVKDIANPENRCATRT